MAESKVFEAKYKDKLIREFLSNTSQKIDGTFKFDSTIVKMIAPIIFKNIKLHFKQTMGPEGKWQGWSDAYKEMQKKRGRTERNMLQDSGNLRKNTNPENYRSKKGELIWFNRAETKKGFPYAYAHNEEREFMWIDEKSQNVVLSIMLARIMGSK